MELVGLKTDSFFLEAFGVLVVVNNFEGSNRQRVKELTRKISYRFKVATHSSR